MYRLFLNIFFCYTARWEWLMMQPVPPRWKLYYWVKP
jgi:hypothetical protein